MMKRAMVVILTATLSLPLVLAQTAPPSGQKTLAATVGVYVFPSSGQDSGQQSKDESDCYDWAVGNTGIDPFDVAKQSQQQQGQDQKAKEDAEKAGKGSGGKGALGGAAAGALIGGIAGGSATKGAAIGAGVGFLGGRHHKKKKKKAAEEAADDQAKSHRRHTQAEMDNFKKAFSVCLEAKDYRVKY
jgi:hypothetical protein